MLFQAGAVSRHRSADRRLTPGLEREALPSTPEWREAAEVKRGAPRFRR